MQSKLGFHVVQVINNEVISAATSLKPTENNAQVLVHCRVEGGGKLAFTLKTSSQIELAELESKHLPQALSQQP